MSVKSRPGETRAYHQQGFAEGPTAFAQYLIGVERDNVAQGKNEWMHVFHVQIVRGHSV